jgi:predicted GNAT family acetyltransferase
MTSETTARTVVDNAQRSRFELDVDGRIVFATYQRQGPVLYIRHVEAPAPLRGTGAAGRLMQGIVEIARAEQLKLAPLCGYAATWIRRHKVTQDLLA